MASDEIKVELDEVERQIETLKVDYEKFFLGIIKVEPYPQKMAIVRVIQKYTRKPITNSMLSFRYRNLSARFLTYQEYWGRMVRLIEEGKNPKDYRIMAERYRINTPNTPAISADTTPDIPAQTSGSDDAFSKMYSDYRDKMMKSNHAPQSPDSFRTFIKRQENALREKYGEGIAVSFEFERTESGVKIKSKIRKKKDA